MLSSPPTPPGAAFRRRTPQMAPSPARPAPTSPFCSVARRLRAAAAAICTTVVLAAPAGRPGRHGHPQFRQRRHRGSGEGGRGDHGPQFHHRPEGQGDDQHRLRASGPEEPRLPDAAVGAAAAGRRRRRKRRHRQAGARSRCADAGRPRHPRPGRRRGRPVGDAGDHAALRIGHAARQRAAAADHAQQHDRRVSREQRAHHHRLRREPEAARAHRRVARPAAAGRAAAGAGEERIGDRPRHDAEPAAERRPGAGRRHAASAADCGSALEQHPHPLREPGPRGARQIADRAARHAGTRGRQHLRHLHEELGGVASRADIARAADGTGKRDPGRDDVRPVSAAGDGDRGRQRRRAGDRHDAEQRAAIHTWRGGDDVHRRRRDDRRRRRVQRAGHPGAGARLQQPARDHRETRCAPRAGVRRGADRRGFRRQGGRARHPVAGADRLQHDADRGSSAAPTSARAAAATTSSTSRSTPPTPGRG